MRKQKIIRDLSESENYHLFTGSTVASAGKPRTRIWPNSFDSNPVSVTKDYDYYAADDTIGQL